MHGETICKQCICYNCSNNDKCSHCQQCIDNNDVQYEKSECNDYKDEN